MLIGKFRLLFIIGLFCAGCNTTPNEQLSLNPNEAWWIAEEFTPSETTIKGIPVTQIMPDWKLALLLDEDYLQERLTDNQFQYIRQSNLTFNVQTNLDNTPDEETFVVGVYETLSGDKGRFIAIFRHSMIIKLFTDADLSGYSSIYLDSDQVRWYKCMECSDYDSIIWSGSDYILQ